MSGPSNNSTEERTERTDFDRYNDQRSRQLADIVRFPEFQRNSEMRELTYDRSALASQRVVVIGTNYTAENVIKQLLAIGFRDIHLWSNERDSRGVSIGKKMLAGLNHVSPYFRGKEDLESLETRAITAGFDELGITGDLKVILECIAGVSPLSLDELYMFSEDLNVDKSLLKRVFSWAKLMSLVYLADDDRFDVNCLIKSLLIDSNE